MSVTGVGEKARNGSTCTLPTAAYPIGAAPSTATGVAAAVAASIPPPISSVRSHLSPFKGHLHRPNGWRASSGKVSSDDHPGRDRENNDPPGNGAAGSPRHTGPIGPMDDTDDDGGGESSVSPERPLSDVPDDAGRSHQHRRTDLGPSADGAEKIVDPALDALTERVMVRLKQKVRVSRAKRAHPPDELAPADGVVVTARFKPNRTFPARQILRLVGLSVLGTAGMHAVSIISPGIVATLIHSLTAGATFG